MTDDTMPHATDTGREPWVSYPESEQYQLGLQAEKDAWNSIPVIAQQLFNATECIKMQGGGTPFDGVITDLWRELLRLAGEPLDEWSPAYMDRGSPRRADESRRRVRINDSTRLLVYRRDGYRCRNCGSAEDLQLDHIYPWSMGGTDELDNLQTLCGPCNQAKAAKV